MESLFYSAQESVPNPARIIAGEMLRQSDCVVNKLSIARPPSRLPWGLGVPWTTVSPDDSTGVNVRLASGTLKSAGV